MRCAFLLQEHPNIRYRQSLEKLIICELQAVLQSFAIPWRSITAQKKGVDTYVYFDLPSPPSDALLLTLSRQAGIALLAVEENGLLRPIERNRAYAFSDDLPHVLKYKGKTNPDFMYLMLHCALAASDFSAGDKLTVLDPMCGKGTGLFCGLCEGYDAIGFDVDQKALRESIDYFTAFLQFHKRKYRKTEQSNTVQGEKPVPSVTFQVKAAGETEASSTLSYYSSDCCLLPRVLKKNSCQIAICDLPYGVQHAPKDGNRLSTLEKVALLAAKSCSYALCKGGVAAFAVNEYTLSRKRMEVLFTEVDLIPLVETPFDDYSHWVEQAITRDLVLAKKK